MKTTVLLMLLVAATAAPAATPTPITADIPAADGVLIHAESRGSGPATLVFVHGWSCDSSYWVDQVSDLARDYRVVTVDLAGHGQSGTERKDYTMAAFGQDVAAVLAYWDLRHVVLIGHSMGGAVIVEAALAAPERMLGLIGVDNFQQLNFKMADAQIDGFVSTFERDFPAFTTQWVSGMFPANADSSLRAGIAADMAAAPPAVALSAMENLLHWYGGLGAKRLALVKVPMMNINSDNPPTDEAAMKAVNPAYQVRYMTGHGHFLFREDPLTFNRLLRETLGEIMPK